MQLKQLCILDVAWECYYTLAIRYYTDVGYSTEILKGIIMQFGKSKFSYFMSDMITELHERHVASDRDKGQLVAAMLI